MRTRRLARVEPLKEAPYLDRTILRTREKPNHGRQFNFSDHNELENPPLLLRKQDSLEEQKKETMKVALSLTKAQLDALIKAASSTRNENGDGVSRSFSRYEVVAAHIWRCACNARGHEYEQPTEMSIVVDIRSRIHIPLPERYFGNTILIMKATSRAGELISNPLGFACVKIREAINKVDEEYIWSNIEILEKKPFHGNPNLRVISWLALPIHEMDFGWGHHVDFFPIACDLDGSSVVLPGLENDGSIVVLLCLQVTHVDKFKKLFYNGFVQSGQIVHYNELISSL